MSQRRTSLSFPIGIVSALLIVDCTAETRDWDTGAISGGAGGNAHAGSSPIATGGSFVSSTSSTASGTTPTQTGGASVVAIGGAGGVTIGSAGEAGLAGVAGVAGTPPRACDDATDCDDGNSCNGIETCVGGTCSTGSLPGTCSGMDTANCRCAPIGGGVCGIVGLDADGDGIKTRTCSSDPGLDCNDSDASVTYNACNGCATLPGAPGGDCGSCGGSKWVCSGTDNAVCSTPAPAPKQCSSGAVQICTAGSWVTESTCTGVTPVCIVQADVPQCGACDTAGTTRCKSGVNNVVETCSSNRLAWTEATCSGSNLCFNFAAGDSRCALCQPGSTRCKPGVSNVVQTCHATGWEWVDTATCGASSACVYSLSLSTYTCAQLVPGDLQNEIEFERTLPVERFESLHENAVGVQPFLDFASGFALV